MRYGAPPSPGNDDVDLLLDRFLPTYDIVERHRIDVAAPAAITLQAAKDQDLFRSRAVRTIFKLREIAMGGAWGRSPEGPRQLLPAVQALGWGVLADVPDHEIVLGAVTRPWEADVVFSRVPKELFQTFWEPGFVKIAWTLRADPIRPDRSTFRTETRAVATDEIAARRFRRYWAFASPGVTAIRQLSLRPLRREAERRAAAARLEAFRG